MAGMTATLSSILLRDLQRYADDHDSARNSERTQEFVGAMRELLMAPEDVRLRFVADIDANPIA